jgi:Ribbon-helix-helix protein, copG family
MGETAQVSKNMGKTTLKQKVRAVTKRLREINPAKDTVRFQIVLTKEALDQIDNLKTRTGAVTRAAVLRDALRLYDALLEETERGNDILIRDNTGELMKYKILH